MLASSTRVGLIVLPALLLGCASQKSDEAMATGPTTLSGLVYLSAPQSIPKDAELTVQIIDATVSGAEKAIASRTEKVTGLPPYAFTLDAGQGVLKQGRVYQARAEIKAGNKRWSHTQAYPVLTGGASDYVEIMVLPR